MKFAEISYDGWRHLKVALGPNEISLKFRVARKKVGQNSTVQVGHRNFCVSRRLAGGATLIQTETKGSVHTTEPKRWQERLL